MDLEPAHQAQIDDRVASLRARMDERPGSLPPRDEALALMYEWTPSPTLRGHMLAVEASMAAYAQKLGEDELLFRLAGLLHDFDYERHPMPTEHPFVGAELLLERGYSSVLVEAILGHATYSGVARTTPVAKALFAVDELTGFLTALAYVRPGGLAGMSYKSFTKKFKTGSFAAGVNRDEVKQGADELGVDMQEHVLFLAEALQSAFPSFPEIDVE